MGTPILARSSDRQFLFPLFQESAGGVPKYGAAGAIPDSDIDQLRAWGPGANMIPEVLTNWDDRDHISKGHEFAAASEHLTWISRGTIDGIADNVLLGLLLLHSMGNIVTVDNLDGSYTHTFSLFDPRTDGLQLPSISFLVRKYVPEGWRKYTGNVIDALSLTGGVQQFLNYTADIIGDGGIPVAATPPTVSFAQHVLLRDSTARINIDAGGGDILQGCQVVDWSIALANNHVTNKHYCPPGDDSNLRDPADSSKGQRAVKTVLGTRTVTGSMMTLTDTIKEDWQDNNTPLKFSFLMEGDTISAGPSKESLLLGFNDVRISGLANSDSDGLITQSFDFEAFLSPGTDYSTFFSAELTNQVAAYGKLVP